MKRAVLILLIIIISGSFNPAFSIQTTIAIIDFVRVMQETKIGKRMTWDLESEKKKKEDALEFKRKKILSLEKQFRKEDDTLSEVKKLNVKQQLEKLQLEFKKEYGRNINEIQKIQQNYIRDYNNKIMPVLKKFSRENKYSAILSSVSVVWADASLNVTDEFIRRVNSEIK